MSVKQDVSYARTAQDIERKYSFGKTFSDMLGLINENRDKVDSVESSLSDKITEQSTTLTRSAEEISARATATVRSELSEDIAEIQKSVDMKLDSDAVKIVVEEKIASGVDKVEINNAGYTFDAQGLKISKDGDEITNVIDNTGMFVKRGDEEMLTANKDGVAATDLHAKTYLIIGEGNGSSRFEDYYVGTEKRTGCFWVGG
jgi:hypothetical protein